MSLASIFGLMIIGLLVYLGMVRKKPAGPEFYSGCLSGILLVLLLELTTQGFIAHVPPWAHPWLTFIAYLVVSFVVLKTLDLLFIEDYLIEKLWRDAKLTEIGEGASEIQKLVIAKGLLK